MNHDAITKAVDALLTAINCTPAVGAVAAYKAAIARHGRNLIDTVSIEALAAVIKRIRDEAPGKAEAQDRERIVLEARNPLLGSTEQAARPCASAALAGATTVASGP